MNKFTQSDSTKRSYISLSLVSLDTQRDFNNIGYLVLFLTLMILHAGISIYAFSNGDLSTFQKHHLDAENSNSLKKFLDKFYDIKWFFFSLLYVAMLSTVLSVYAIRLLPGVLVRIAIVCECLNLGIIILYIRSLLFHLELITFKNHFLAIIVLTYFCIAKLSVVSKVGIKLTCEIVKESRNDVYRPPYSIMLSILTSVLTFFVVLFALFVCVHLSTIRTDDAVPFYVYVLHVVNAYAAIRFCLYIFYFGQMVRHGTFASRYWTMDKASISHYLISKNFLMTFRYHLGTIAYRTSFWVIFPAIYSIIKSLKSSPSVSQQTFFDRLLYWWNTYCKLLESNIGVCAIQRRKLDKAADIVCKLYVRNPLRLLAITKAFEKIAVILASLLGVFVVLAIFSFFLLQHVQSMQFLVATAVVMISHLIITIPLIIIINAIICTIYCILEHHDDDQEVETELE